MKNIIFILFPGFFGSNKFWSNKFIDNKLIKIDFLDELNKIGFVYIYKPNFYNLYFYKKDEIYKELFEKDIYFNNDDLNIEKICFKIFNQFKHNYKYFVPIGHSYGSIYVHKFITLFYNHCLFSVIIDGTPLGPVSKVMALEDEKYNIDIIDDDKLLLLQEKIIDKKSRNKLIDYVDKTIGKQRPKIIDDIKVSILSFINFNTESKKKIVKQINIDRINEINYFNQFNNYVAICFKNCGHYIHWNDEACLKIISYIKDICINNI
jgi:hypothetical protein